MNEEKEVEAYSLSDSIDFSKFISELLDNDLKETISFEDIGFTPSEQEEVLIKVLNYIKDNYNKKVEEYLKFVSEYPTNDSITHI